MGGAFTLDPIAAQDTRREYLEGTNVLVTTFCCDDGALEATDVAHDYAELALDRLLTATR